MDRQQILLGKALDAAGLPLSVETFDDRLILQKTVYLLQAAGVHLGYRFRWYLRGPYCPEMTAAAFGIVGEGDAAQQELRGWSLDDASKDRIEKLKPFLAGPGDKAAKARRMELLASILFLINTHQAKANEPEEIAATLKKFKKNYDAKAVREAIHELRGHGFAK
jgi:uncharacterized protein YwgA